MKQKAKGSGRHMHLTWTELIAGIALILIGLVLLIWPGIATNLLFGAIGAVCIIIGGVSRNGSCSPSTI